MTTSLLDRPPTTPPPAGDLTRREFVTGLLAAGLLTACGGNSGTNDTGSGPTREFVDIYGNSVKVPNEPKRIVAIHDGAGGLQVLELGGALIGMASRGGTLDVGGPVEYELDRVADAGEVYEPNIEAIVNLRPDLIVGEGYQGKGMDQFMTEGVQAQLESIAPVVYIDTFRPVDEVMADFAELLGPKAEARLDEISTDYRQAVAQAKERLAPKVAAGLTAVFVQMKAASTLDVWGDTSIPLTTTLTALGVPQPPVSNEKGPGSLVSISLERLPDASADVIFLEAGGGEFQGDYTGNPLWQALPAVKAGQVARTDDRAYGTSYATYSFVLGEVMKALGDADPAVVT
jgi:iron complex transport system substrate-binding protein